MELNRRTFLARGCQALGATSLLPVVGCRPQPVSDSSTQPQLSSAITQYLDKTIPELLSQTKVPGLSIAVVQDASLAWRRSYGMADVEARTPTSDDTVFEAGSVSKTVFAYAVMKLVESGTLLLDSPLTMYWPERLLDDPRLDQITVRRALSHTTGLPNWRSSKEPFQLAFTPGERWSYSGEGYWYLQSVVTHLLGRVNQDACSVFEDGLRVCATDIGDYLKANVLMPFGMASSGYVWNEDYERRVAQGYDVNGQLLPRRRATATTAARYASAGGLHATATDYARFLIEVLDPKPPDRNHLTVATCDEMLRPQVKVDATSSWALGWQVVHGSLGDVITHGGDNPGFKAFVVASVRRKAGWVILMNGDNAGPIIQTLVDLKCPLNEIFA